ncbi:hypothetical protein R3W88_026549 [Solanum pinnatisectum]|uniref:Uncharacterized protein n=1 Tax=Solanum pinnatisectum TaxID=50273 RepID=A0AAV9LGY4_9SOLN|nr:hypothetical protein R3W88_026549 [Solanum pinnatisectum]
MADPVIGAIVQVLLEKLLSLTIEKVSSSRDCNKHLRMMTQNVSIIQAFIHDAQKQQVDDDQAVEKWLMILERVVEDVKNVLDEFTYESLKAQVRNSPIRKVSEFFSHSAFISKISQKIKNINEELRAINQLAKDLGLQSLIVPSQQIIRMIRETDSLVVASNVVGRDNDVAKIKEKILNMRKKVLLYAIPIVGMGDLGKTTIAKRIFNDEEIKKHFEKRDEFMDSLRGINTFRGNCILVTTRMKLVACTVAAVGPHMLEKLAKDHCWSIFKQRAFVDGKVLEEIVSVKNRIQVCWEEKHEWWDILDGNHLVAGEDDNGENSLKKILKLSDVYLPSPYLKKCFSYFAMFPKDFMFGKDQFIQLWMVERFLHPYQQTTVMEDVGHKFFQILLRNSLLQDVELDEHSTITYCKMHDLVHDLAGDILKSKLFDPKGNDGEKLSQEKPNIYRLAYLWSHNESKGCEINHEHVLDGLQPHPNLKTLEVVIYFGTIFPSWFSEGLLPNLVKLKLSGCKRSKEIPSLGQLKFFWHLELIGFLELECIGPTFYGVEINDNGSSSNNGNCSRH